MLIGEVPIVTVKCRTAIKALCLSVKLDSLSYPFTSISFLTNSDHIHNISGNLAAHRGSKYLRFMSMFCRSLFVL